MLKRNQKLKNVVANHRLRVTAEFLLPVKGISLMNMGNED